MLFWPSFDACDHIDENLAVILSDLHSIIVYYRLQYSHAKFQPTRTTIGVFIYETVLKNKGSKNCPNDGIFYFTHYFVNSHLDHTIPLLIESQEAIILCIIFLDYYVIYLICFRSFFPKPSNIGTVF